MDKSIKNTRIELLLLFALYIFILPRVYMDYDMGFWRQWALSIHHAGLSHTYDTPVNYFPVYVYALYIYDLLQGTDLNITRNINNIKVLFVFFDFLPLFVLCGFRQKLLTFKVPYLFLLLNIAYVFNSMVWGQIDSIYANTAFLAILTAIFYPIAATVMYVFALNAKPQAIEFLPVMGIMLAYSVRSFKTAFSVVGAAVVFQLLLLLPFISTGGVSRLWSISTHLVGLYPKLSICAFNIWYLIARGNPYFINDSDTYVILSYKLTGMLMFGIASMWILVPLFKKVWSLRIKSASFDTHTYTQLFLGTGLVCLYFFYFNSQMHERYAQPVIIFFFFYGVVSRNYKLYILASIPYFLSLDKCFPDYLPIIHYKLIYASVIIAFWYTATVAYGSYLYYRHSKAIISTS